MTDEIKCTTLREYLAEDPALTDTECELVYARAEIRRLNAVIADLRAELDRKRPGDGDAVQLEILELRGELAKTQLEVKKLAGQLHLMVPMR